MDAITPTRHRKHSGMSSQRRLFHTPVNMLEGQHSRRWLDLYNEYCDALGGEDAVAEATRTTVRRIATLQCVLEQRELEFIKSGKQTRDQTAEYQSMTTTVSRLMKTLSLLGMKKQADEGDDGLDPLTYAKSHKRKRSHLNDDEEED